MPTASGPTRCWTGCVRWVTRSATPRSPRSTSSANRIRFGRPCSDSVAIAIPGPPTYRVFNSTSTTAACCRIGLTRLVLYQPQMVTIHPPYIRVACTGKGDYDDLAGEYGYQVAQHPGDAGPPVVLEIWPARHYSPMHSHGGTAGIIYCLAGQIDVMVYGGLGWDADRLGLLTLTPGQCAWLAGDQFSVHKVHSPMDGGSKAVGPNNLLNETDDFAATFHVYLNEDEAIPDT